MPSYVSSVAASLSMGASALALSARALLAPLPKRKDVAQRLKVFPTRGLKLEGRVTIYWNERQIPFIEANGDGDAAFALGLVHAHLRLGQIATARMLARGRLSEMIGPAGVGIDRGLRALSYGAAAAEIERNMDEATLLWVGRFVDGLNHYQDSAARLPHDFGVLGLKPEPWTVADLLAIGRLAGTDVNWLVWADLLPLRARADWPDLWARLVKEEKASLPGFDGREQNAAMQQGLGGLSRSGSNSVAVAGHRSATGGALMANDPHLGILVPNVWLIAGVRSPSCHAVGLMPPGLPVFAIGRNPHIAWGGTNLRAASSDLYDVGEVPESEIAERRERIGVRWWFDTEATVRETRWGPIVTDAPPLARFDLPPLALKWTGHDASDEIGAMLAVSRARSFDEFRAAFDRFAVPGQNMLYADAEGNIGQVMAAWLPARAGAPADIVLDTDAHDDSWGAMRTGADLPCILKPEIRLPGLGQQPAAGDRHPGGVLLLARRPRAPHGRADRERRGGERRDPENAAARRIHGVLGDAARPLRCRARRSGADRGGRHRGRRGDRPVARLGRCIPARVPRRGRVRAVSRGLRRALLRPSPRRGKRPRLSPRRAGRRRCWKRTSPPRTTRRCARGSRPGCARPRTDSMPSPIGGTCTVFGSRTRCGAFRSSGAGTDSPKRVSAEARRR